MYFSWTIPAGLAGLVGARHHGRGIRASQDIFAFKVSKTGDFGVQMEKRGNGLPRIRNRIPVPSGGSGVYGRDFPRWMLSKPKPPLSYDSDFFGT